MSVIPGFDYRIGQPVEMSLREWRRTIRDALKAGCVIHKERPNKDNNYIPYPPPGETVVFDNGRPRRPMFEVYAEVQL